MHERHRQSSAQSNHTTTGRAREPEIRKYVDDDLRCHAFVALLHPPAVHPALLHLPPPCCLCTPRSSRLMSRLSFILI